MDYEIDLDNLGRNLDYGHVKSDSREGQMAMRNALTMAKDLYTLYTSLNEEDDLPEWCHYKLATSKKDLSDVTDYISSKIVKKCLDKGMDIHDLRLEITDVIGDELLENRLNEFFFNRKKKQKPATEYNTAYAPVQANTSYRRGYNNQTIHFINSARKLASKIRSSLASNIKGESSHIIEFLLKDSEYYKTYLTLIRDECQVILSTINDIQISQTPKHSSEPKITSARKTPQKKSFFKRLFGESVEEIVSLNEKEIVRLIENCVQYFLDENLNVNKDIRQIIALKNKSEIELLKKQLKFIIDLINYSFNISNQHHKIYNADM